MKLRLLSILVLSGLFFSCTTQVEKDILKIEDLDKRIYSEEKMSIDRVIAEEAIVEYVKFADNYPEDEMSAEYLFRAAEVSKNIGKKDNAIKYYNRTYNSYPEYEKAPFCLFFQAVIYEENFGDYKKSKELYDTFLLKYPEHDFADDVKALLENLGLSPEELIEKFESNLSLNNDTLVP